jgi:prepilin-type N-terminal cleavage/methylation domain-containing protein
MTVKRPGITLIEVLAAIFIMGIGMLALLVLFPLGALSMARAVRDDRAAAAGANASALAVAFDLRNDANVVTGLTMTPAGFAAPDPGGPGYPVFVDPYYVLLGQGALGAVGGTTPGLNRVSPTYVPSAARINRFFSFPDEMEFDPVGTPTGSTNSPQTVNRPGTYTWAYVVRRSQTQWPTLAEVSVVVYATRNTEIAGGENVYTAADGTAGQNTLQLGYAGDRPNLRKGSWILDSTYRTTATAAGTFGTVNAFFYRVSNVSDAGPGTLNVELETDLKANATTVVAMENVIAVLDRGTTYRP